MSTKELSRKVTFPELGDERGNLVVVEGAIDIPFEIKRAFFIYGSDATVVRGCHANRISEFVLINVSGSSKVMVTDGSRKEIIELTRPRDGVYIPRMMWKEMYEFSKDAVLMVLASTHYDSSEYIRDYNEYLKEMQSNA